MAKKNYGLATFYGPTALLLVGQQLRDNAAVGVIRSDVEAYGIQQADGFEVVICRQNTWFSAFTRLACASQTTAYMLATMAGVSVEQRLRTDVVHRLH